MAMKRIPIGLTMEQHERLRGEARRRKTTVANLVRRAVDETYPDGAQLRREAHLRSFRILGAFNSGRADISERHDDYLAEALWNELRKP